MTQEKSIEILRKRNTMLQTEVDRLKEQLNIEKENSKKVSSTLLNLEELKNKWRKELQIIKDQQNQYTELISDLQSLKNIKNILEE